MCWWGKGDVKATDFLTSPLRWLPTTNLCAWEPGMGNGEEEGGLEEGALPSPHIKSRLPQPLSWLREGPRDSKNDRE